MIKKIQAFLEKYIAPIAEKLNSSDIIKALSRGMMYTMPVVLGVSILAVVVNLPIDQWQAFLKDSNLSAVCNQLLAVTMNLLAPYVVLSIGYNHGKLKGVNGITSAIVSLSLFLVFMPLVVNEGERSVSYMIDVSYLGSNGIFMAIVLGIVVSWGYSVLMKKLAIKLPDAVPSMVTDSLSPTFVAIILFTAAFFIKWAMTFTSFGNLFDLVNQILATPIMNIGSSPLALIFAYSFASLLWFFGVHPSAILNVFSPAISICLFGNMEAFMSGTPVTELPHLTFAIIYAMMSIGGSGNMLGLGINMLTAKSERYKALSKMAFIPSIFNISEPMMFGVPVVLNPTFFVPMVISTPIIGFVAWGLSSFGLGNSLNPAVMSPWVMPKPISALMSGGFGLLVISLVSLVIAVVLYYPFFKVADKMALDEEKAVLEGEAYAE